MKNSRYLIPIIFINFIFLALIPAFGQKIKLKGKVFFPDSITSQINVYINGFSANSSLDGSFSITLTTIQKEGENPPKVHVSVEPHDINFKNFSDSLSINYNEREPQLPAIKLERVAEKQIKVVGRVIDAKTEEPIEEVSIHIDSRYTLSTSVYGRFERFIPEKKLKEKGRKNEYEVRATKKGYAPFSAPKYPLRFDEEGGAFFPDIKLVKQQSIVISGNVKNKKGESLQGIIVTVSCNDSISTKTNSQGFYQLTINPEIGGCAEQVQYEFDFSDPGKKYLSGRLEKTIKEATSLNDENITLKRNNFRWPLWVSTGSSLLILGTTLYLKLRPIPLPDDDPIK